MSAYYSASYIEFTGHTDSHVLGELFRSDGFATDILQKDAWAYEISSLRQTLSRTKFRDSFRLLFEFKSPEEVKELIVFC